MHCSWPVASKGHGVCYQRVQQILNPNCLVLNAQPGKTLNANGRLRAVKQQPRAGPWRHGCDIQPRLCSSERDPIFGMLGHRQLAGSGTQETVGGAFGTSLAGREATAPQRGQSDERSLRSNCQRMWNTSAARRLASELSRAL
eukprot:s3168_g5.t1